MDAIAKALLGLLAVAFTAWAGVVYQTGQAAMRLTEINQEKVLQVTDRVLELRDMVARHASEGHRESVTSLALLRQQIKENDRRLDALEVEGRKRPPGSVP